MIIYVHFILFEGIGKNFPLNSILDFAILSYFKMMTYYLCVYVCVCRGWGRGGGFSVGFQPAKSLPPPIS